MGDAGAIHRVVPLGLEVDKRRVVPDHLDGAGILPGCRLRDCPLGGRGVCRHQALAGTVVRSFRANSS